MDDSKTSQMTKKLDYYLSAIHRLDVVKITILALKAFVSMLCCQISFYIFIY